MILGTKVKKFQVVPGYAFLLQSSKLKHFYDTWRSRVSTSKRFGSQYVLDLIFARPPFSGKHGGSCHPDAP